VSVVDIQKVNRDRLLSEWAEMVSQCRNSGQTVATWCAEHGINTKSYYYRLKRVCAAIPNGKKPSSLPVPCEEPVFAELAPGDRVEERSAVITIRASGMEIQIPNGVETRTIEATLRAVSRIC
jgi:hypothetical protein